MYMSLSFNIVIVERQREKDRIICVDFCCFVFSFLKMIGSVTLTALPCPLKRLVYSSIFW